jgi:membrane-bound serine protease (ClpP class)
MGIVRTTVLALLLASFFFPSVSRSGTGVVHVITIDGTINPAAADYIHTQIAAAAEARAECLIIRLNTPGGLLKSTRVIVSDFLTSEIPIVIYVAPPGAQAASAGVFVTLAAHIAVMAPGTNIGAAHPVGMGEQLDSVMSAKATNDAAAFIRTISEQRKRNVAWAEDAVRKSVSITEKEALKEHVIDTVAASIEALLSMLDGKVVQTPHAAVKLATAHASVVTIERSFAETLLDILSDPNIAYIFMMLGIYGLLFELYNPGLIFPGIVGVVSLILAFYSLHTLPINYAGLALIVFAIILFVLEIKVASHGMLTVGGVVALLLGSLMLVRTDSAFDIITISWKVIAIAVIFTAFFFLVIIGLGIRAQKRKPVTGVQGIVGEYGETLTALDPDGRIRIHGEDWSAKSIEGRIEAGSKVLAEGIDRLTLLVRKASN